jgi:hypothetical protein
MEGRCYVMKGLVSGISSAYLSSGVSTRGQRRLHHAANGGLFAREEGDDAPQNSCRTIRKLKGECAFPGSSGHGIYLARKSSKVLGKQRR